MGLLLIYSWPLSWERRMHGRLFRNIYIYIYIYLLMRVLPGSIFYLASSLKPSSPCYIKTQMAIYCNHPWLCLILLYSAGGLDKKIPVPSIEFAQVLWYDVYPYNIISYHTIPYHVVSLHITSNDTVSHHVISYHIAPSSYNSVHTIPQHFPNCTTSHIVQRWRSTTTAVLLLRRWYGIIHQIIHVSRSHSSSVAPIVFM